MEADNVPPDADQRAKFDAAFAAGRYGSAFGAYQLGVVRRAVALLSQSDYIIDWRKQPQSTLEFVGGIAAALDETIQNEGDAASYKLIVVRDVIGAVADMQSLLEKRFESDMESSDLLAGLILQGVRLGTMEIMLGQTEGGFLDEYANLKWREELDRRRRQKAAASTNDGRARQKGLALRTAQEIAKVNPALGNDDLAFAVKQKANMPHAIRTLTEWIRGWRKDGRLPPLARR